METILNALYSVIMFLIMIGIIVAIHEGGHFVIGRMCNIRMLEYCIGMGKKPIWQKRVGKDQTLVTIRLFPIGGFVRPLQEPSDMESEERKFWDSLPEEEKNRSLERAPRWKRALMVFGGPASNFVLAFLVLFGAYSFIGEKMYQPIVSDVVKNSNFEKSGFETGDIIDTINGEKIYSAAKAYDKLIFNYINGGDLVVTTKNGKSTEISFSGNNLGELKNPLEKIGIYISGNIGKVKVENLKENGIAEKSGLQKNDIILFIDDVKMNNPSRVIQTIGYTDKEILTIKVLRDGVEKEIVVKPEYDDKSKRKLIGVELISEIKKDNFIVKKYGFMEAVEIAYNKVVSSTLMQAVSIKKLITGELSYKNLSSPIAMADYSGLTAKQGAFQYLSYIALISIAVGLFNLLPLPILDGGHLIILAVEGIIRKDLPVKVMQSLQLIGLSMIIGVFCIALFNDLSKYIFN